MSAWDSDSDDDEASAASTLRDWFTQRTSEDGKRQKQRTKPDDAGAERARLMKREKAMKRREEFKRNFSTIQEELGLQVHSRYL